MTEDEMEAILDADCDEFYETFGKYPVGYENTRNINRLMEKIARLEIAIKKEKQGLVND